MAKPSPNLEKLKDAMFQFERALDSLQELVMCSQFKTCREYLMKARIALDEAEKDAKE